MQDVVDILRGALASLGGMLLRTGGRFAFLLVAGNLYGAARFGTLAYTIVIVETLAAFSVFGFKRSLFPMLSGDEREGDPDREKIILNAIVLAFGLSLLATFLLMIFWRVIDLPVPDVPDGGWVRGFALVIPLIVLSDVLLAATRHHRIVRFEVFSRSIFEPWTLAAMAGLFFVLGFLEWGLLAAYFIALAAAFLVAAYGFSRLYNISDVANAGLSLRLIRGISFQSGPTALVDVLALLIRRIDIIFLWHFTTDAIVGAYHAAQHIASLVQKTRQIFDPILTPVVAQTGARKGARETGQQIGQICRWVLTLTLLQAILIGFYADFALEIVGDGMVAAAVALVILLVAEVIDGTLASAELPIVFQKPYLNLGLSALGVSVHITGCLLLVPRFGPEGAAFSLLIALTLLNAARIAVCRAGLGVTILSLGFLKPITAALIALLAGIGLDQWLGVQDGWMMALGAGAILAIYVLGLRMLGLSGEDRELISYLRGNRKAL